MTVDAKELAMRPKKPKPEDGEGKKLSHGKMHGLNNDDHAHYLTADRGDKRYYTKTEIDIFFGGLAGDFYTNERVEDSLAAVEKSFTALLSSAPSSKFTKANDPRLSSYQVQCAY